MRLLALPRGDVPLVVAGALLLLLAYPPFHLLLPSFVCVVPVVWLIVGGSNDTRPLRRRLVQGFWYGLLAQGLVLYWMVVALWHFTPLSAAGYLATITILAVYSAGLFAVTGWITDRIKVPLWIALPSLWTTLEWWVGHQGDGSFPWLGLGTSLTGYPTLVQIADVVGARGVTFLLVLANTALALAWQRRRERRAFGPVVAVGIGVLMALSYGSYRLRTIETHEVGKIGLVQPNVGFAEKWVEDRQRDLFEDLLTLSRASADSFRPDLVIWPEAAVQPSYAVRPSWWRRVGALASETGIPILTGGTDDEWDGNRRVEYWNAAFLVERDGVFNRFPPYHKRYLVPITERVPFVDPDLFDLEFFGGFGVGEPGGLFDAGLGPFGVIICYESAYEDLARRYRSIGADFMVNITNDAWFGRTSAPYQHFAHLVMRAIENRVGIARAGNSGISGFVDPFGRSYGTTPLGVRLHTAGILVTSDARTVYTRLGDWVGLLSIVTSVLLIGYTWWRKK